MEQTNNNKAREPKELKVGIILTLDPSESNMKCDNGKFFVDNIDSYQNSVILHKSAFKDIFGVHKYEYIQKHSALIIVKISYNKRIIYRKVELLSILGQDAKYIGLTNKSLGYLTQPKENEKGEIRADRPEKDSIVVIEKGHKCHYYWHHPNSATRMSFRIGLPSLAISIISLLYSLQEPICELLCKVCKFICKHIHILIS